VDHARARRGRRRHPEPGLRAGSLSSAQASLTIATPIASVIGWTVFGERLDENPTTVAVALACAALAVVGVVLLSRSDALATPTAPATVAMPASTETHGAGPRDAAGTSRNLDRLCTEAVHEPSRNRDPAAAGSRSPPGTRIL
jgi:hypothetical protein